MLGSPERESLGTNSSLLRSSRVPFPRAAKSSIHCAAVSRSSGWTMSTSSSSTHRSNMTTSWLCGKAWRSAKRLAWLEASEEPTSKESTWSRSLKAAASSPPSTRSVSNPLTDYYILSLLVDRISPIRLQLGCSHSGVRKGEGHHHRSLLGLDASQPPHRGPTETNTRLYPGTTHQGARCTSHRRPDLDQMDQSGWCGQRHVSLCLFFRRVVHVLIDGIGRPPRRSVCRSTLMLRSCLT